MKSVVVGTAGHIDHGKSTLVQALTGIDPDRLKEEKVRGITIDLGFAHVAIGDINFAFVDVPGHERFVKNMLAGVGGIDLVLLVVAADESVMPQTREHFDICRLLRVPAGAIALTKVDRVDADTLELVRLEVRELAAGSFLASAPSIAVSSRTGQGLDDLRAALVKAGSASIGRPIDGAARLPVDRVFSMKGFGTIVTGTLVSGRLRVDEELLVAPGGRRAKVRGIQVHGAARGEVVAGQRAALNLAGVEVDDLQRGQTLMRPGTFEQSRLLDVVLEILPDARPVRHGARVRFHQGTSEILGRVATIGLLPSAGMLQPGSRGYVRLRLESPAVLVRGDRFILRTYSPARTIAGGHVLDPVPPRRTAIRTGSAVERCRRLDFDPADAGGRLLEGELRAALVMIEDAGASGLPISALVSRVGIGPRDVLSRIETLTNAGVAVHVSDVLVARPIFARLQRSIVDGLTAHHRSQPLSEGLPREEARVRLFGRGHAAVFDRVLEDLIVARSVVGRDRLALASHHVEWSPDLARARVTIERTFRDAGLAPPDQASLASVSGTLPDVVDQVVRLLQREKVLVKVDTLVFHDETLRRLKQEVGAMKTLAGANATIDVRTFKERFGVTRKFAIPLLEYLDRERVTRRVGEARLIL
jgi:selenocysteine-specific elongation factor